MAGNANSGPKREKPWVHALRMELAAGGEDHKSLRQIAKVVIAQAKSGDLAAVKEIAERLDGKALQTMESHNVNEYVFAEVPKTDNKDEWTQSLAAAAGVSSPAHKRH